MALRSPDSPPAGATARPLVVDAALRARLRHVSVARLGIALDRFPDFLIVGPQRTGTTWLHAHLRYHPQIFLSEPKELFFFSRLKTPRDPKFQSSDLGWYLRFFRDPLWRALMKNAVTLWRFRAAYRPRVRGEATASYAALDADVIGDVVALRPDIKVILMIRDPIERAWSHAKKDLARKRRRRAEEVPDAEFRAFFTDPYQRRCAQYVENCDRWAAQLQPQHLRVLRFDDIGTRPEALLLEVMEFLGVRADRRCLSGDVRASVNPTGPSRMPAHHRQFLQELFRHELDALRRRFQLSWPA